VGARHQRLEDTGLLRARQLQDSERAFSMARTMLRSTSKNTGTCTCISTIATPPAGISVVWTFLAGVSPPTAPSV
jgi:hypothetical protein